MDGNEPAGKISLAELRELVANPDVSEAALRDYFIRDPKRSSPMSPTFMPNPERVDMSSVEKMQFEGKLAVDLGNSAERLRRHRRFRHAAANDPRPVLVSEGDSWFQFPFVLQDVIDQLEPDYRIWSVGAAGDTLKQMRGPSPDYMDALLSQRDRVKAFLFSGGGNDIVGAEEPEPGSGWDAEERSVLERILRPFEPGLPSSSYIDTDGFRTTLAFVKDSYVDVIETVNREFPGLPILIHGYAHALPGGFPGDPRKPDWAKPDEWIGRFLRSAKLGIADSRLQAQIVAHMIDKLNEMQIGLAGGNHPGGRYPNVFHIDARGIVTDITHWADELHPTDEAFARVAAKFRDVLARIAVGSRPRRPRVVPVS